MTWLSRLLPQRTRYQDRHERRRMSAKQRRRISFLEPLETRRVLSSVTVSGGLFTGPITITADRFANKFSIAEYKVDGGTRVTVSALDPQTLINGGSSWSSLAPVTAITVNHQSGSQADNDVVVLYGEGKGVLETTKNVTFNVNKTNLTLDVYDINNPGAFKLTTHGQLNLTMDNNQWNSLSVTQDGCCPAHVSITNSTVSGSVNVKEGWGDGSSIYVDNSQFGATVLQQYYGTQPTTGNCTGANDSIEVTNSRVITLDIIQSNTAGTANGVANYANVDTLLVAQNNSTYFGVRIRQGDGDGDVATVNNVTTYGTPNLRRPPCAGILITQGDGDGDYASATNSTVPGDVIINQGDGAGDEALIDNVAAGLPFSTYCGKIAINQGDGKGDSATITNSSTAELDVCINQGDGELDVAYIELVDSGDDIFIVQGTATPSGEDPHGGDSASILFSTAGGSVKIIQHDTSGSGASSAVIDTVDAGWDICIVQGDANGDTAEIYYATSAEGDICITQGNGDGDTARIDNALAYYGEICITQGNGNGDTATVSFSSAYWDIKISQGDGDGDTATVEYSSGDDICITQGDGSYDTATVACSDAYGNVYVFQGDGNEDTVNILGVIAGWVDFSGGYPYDVDGDVVVVQGDGYHDVVNVDECDGVLTEINNLYITQGDSVPYDGCEPGLSDEIHINDSYVTSDIIIHQGYTDGEETGFGYYIVDIGSTSPVYAGGWTSISQAGEGNFLSMTDFTTTWLDVWMGWGGGATVLASNTVVLYGSYYGNDFTIDAGDGGYEDSGNVYIDLGGNDGVTVSESFYVVSF